MNGLYVRREKKTDIEAIRRVHEASFTSPLEAELVDNLQAEGDGVLSLVAWLNGEICGHIMFSRMKAIENRGLRVTALAPLAVLPENRGRGIGGKMVRDGLEWLKADGEDVVIVLGDPEFYGRFGFTTKAAQAFETPYDGPHLQALALTEAGQQARGLLRYARAFSMMA
jgi:putative acetyltransferase